MTNLHRKLKFSAGAGVFFPEPEFFLPEPEPEPEVKNPEFAQHYLVPSLIKYFEHNVANFKAGQLNTFYFAWKDLTSDSEILETVSGQRIEFHQKPVQLNLPVQPNYSCQQGQTIY